MAINPYFEISKKRLKKNLKIAASLSNIADVEIYFTLKALNHLKVIKYIAKELNGFSVSSKAEAKLAKKAGAKKINLYTVALEEFELNSIDRVSFNSINQYKKYASRHKNIGIRVNPDISISNECNYTSPHLGVNYNELLELADSKILKNLKGLHFHVMFNANENDLNMLLEHILKTYKPFLNRLKWLNLGGGYNITEFNKNKFKKIVENFKKIYPSITLILEPGEGILKDVGRLNCKILDIVDNNIIVNTSTQTHLLDVSMVGKKYKIKQSCSGGVHEYNIYGNSCISNDLFGSYTFSKPPKIGNKISFLDTASYTLSKNTNFTLTKFPKVDFS